MIKSAIIECAGPLHRWRRGSANGVRRAPLPCACARRVLKYVKHLKAGGNGQYAVNKLLVLKVKQRSRIHCFTWATPSVLTAR